MVLDLSRACLANRIDSRCHGLPQSPPLAAATAPSGREPRTPSVMAACARHAAMPSPGGRDASPCLPLEELRLCAAGGGSSKAAITAAAPLTSRREAGPGMANAARRRRCPSAHTGADEVGTLPLLTKCIQGGRVTPHQSRRLRETRRDSFPSRGSHECRDQGSPCHCETVTDVTVVAIRFSPWPRWICGMYKSKLAAGRCGLPRQCEHCLAMTNPGCGG